MDGDGHDKRTISAEQVAILADRVDTLINNYSRIEGMLLSSATQQSALTQQLAVFQERLAQMGENLRRTNDISDQSEERLETLARRHETLSEKVTVHSWAWKLFGTVAVLSLGLVSWAFNMIQENNQAINEQKSMSRMHEYQIQQNAATARLFESMQQGPTGPQGPAGPTGPQGNNSR